MHFLRFGKVKGSMFRLRSTSVPYKSGDVKKYDLVASPKGLIGKGKPVPLKSIQGQFSSHVFKHLIVNVTILNSLAKVEMTQNYFNEENQPIGKNSSCLG